jgi:hypothetical protein
VVTYNHKHEVQDISGGAMLTETQRQSLSEILERAATLAFLTIDLDSRQASVVLSVRYGELKEEGITFRLRGEAGEMVLGRAGDPKEETFTFRLQGLSRVAVDSSDKKLPRELIEVPHPSGRFMVFLGSLFQNQPIFEWTCFGVCALQSRKWKWKIDLKKRDTEPNEYVQFFKDRPSGHWVIGFWFSQLEIVDCRDVSVAVDEFIGKYPTGSA